MTTNMNTKQRDSKMKHYCISIPKHHQDVWELIKINAKEKDIPPYKEIIEAYYFVKNNDKLWK